MRKNDFESLFRPWEELTRIQTEIDEGIDTLRTSMEDLKLLLLQDNMSDVAPLGERKYHSEYVGMLKASMKERKNPRGCR